ncbi:MAG: MAPEG family protein [Gammaproteobacteria bacterium]|nr:MAPEG family protein [Gammaproteobacteria bacterium]
MTTVLYASLATFLIIWLSFNVIKLRRKHQISIGYGGKKDLKLATTAHSNAIEYLPISLLLLFALELNQANLILLHILGILVFASRVLHANSILTENLKRRVFAMQTTFICMTVLALANLAYLPFEKLSVG